MSFSATNVSLELQHVSILRDVTVTVNPGELTVLVGPNGAGKSSLLKLLSGEIKPSRGVVSLNGINIESLSALDQSQHRSVMSQVPTMAFDFLVNEVLEMGWVQAGRWGESGFVSGIESVVKSCELVTLLDRRYGSLSGGERQRVQFARALLQVWCPNTSTDYRYMLLDEPTSSLDIAHELQLLNLSRRKCDDGVGVLMVLHDLNLAARFASNVVLLKDGEVVRQGVPGEVFEDKALTDTYKTRVKVERHRELDRLVIFT